MNFRAVLFGVAILGGGLTFGQDVQGHSIPAMVGNADVSAAFDGGSCAGKVAFVDGGCLVQLRRITEGGRTLNVTSAPTPAACGQSVTIHKCTFACGCPPPKPVKPAKKP